VVRVRDIVRYRRAVANMEERYPEATEEELAQTDRVCIICREEMTSSARKLPCGHVFHFRCLRSWLERQQACPTCRRPITERSPSPVHSPDAEPNREQPVHVPNPPAQPAEPQQHGPQAFPPVNRQVLVWRNGRWTPAAPPGDPQQQPLQDQARIQQPRPPTFVYPNFAPASPNASPISNTAMLGMPPGMANTAPLPVILIPPEQVALVQVRPQQQLQEGQRQYVLRQAPDQGSSILLDPIAPANLPSSLLRFDHLTENETGSVRSAMQNRLQQDLIAFTRLQAEIGQLTSRISALHRNLSSTTFEDHDKENEKESTNNN